MKNPFKIMPLLAALSVLFAAASLTPASASGWDAGRPIAGTYYLALSVDPFGLPLPPGLSLPGLMTLHADRTATIVDGGDFGGLPFDTKDSPQLGAWRYGWEGIEVVFLFLQADGATGDVRSWQRVHITLRNEDRNTLVGEVNVYQLPCDGPAPFGIFNCPDPIENATAFTPNSPPDVPVTLRRLSAWTARP